MRQTAHVKTASRCCRSEGFARFCPPQSNAGDQSDVVASGHRNVKIEAEAKVLLKGGRPDAMLIRFVESVGQSMRSAGIVATLPTAPGIQRQPNAIRGERRPVNLLAFLRRTHSRVCGWIVGRKSPRSRPINTKAVWASSFLGGFGREPRNAVSVNLGVIQGLGSGIFR